jgi:putative protein kinase ArgK-like GTPase of G3E family
MKPEKIIKVVCEYYGTDSATILSRTRKAEILEKRQMLQYFLRQKYSLMQVGDLTNVNHATVINAVKRIKNYIETEKRVKYDYDYISWQLKVYGTKTTTLRQLAEIWTKRIDKLNMVNTYKAVCLHAEMCQRMVDILYWAKKMNIK